VQKTNGTNRRHIALVASILLLAMGPVGGQPRKVTAPAASGGGTLMVNGKTFTL